MRLFLRLTALIALGIVVLIVIGILIKALFLAALIAGLILVGLFGLNFVRRLAGGAGAGPPVPR